MSALLADLRHAWRALRARPAFTLTAIATLAIGIGMTTAIYSIVQGILLRPLDFPDARRLITICESFPGSAADWCGVAPPNVEDIGRRSHTIAAIGVARSWGWQMRTETGSESVSGGIASEGVFRALGVRPLRGRLLEPDDRTLRAGRVAVIAEEMWRDRFGAAPDIVGRTITLDDEPVTIVGVLPARVQVPQLEWVQLWRALSIDPSSEEHREWRGFIAYGRLAPGVSLGQARAELATIAEGLRVEHFANTPGWGLTERPLQDIVVGTVRPMLLLFFGAVVVVLLIACANVANLVLARGSSRTRELALRAALGAERRQLIRALLVESGVLALAGAASGVVIAVWGVQAFRALAPDSVPRLEATGVDGGVIAFALALGIVTTLLFGLAPAVRATRISLSDAMREGARGHSAKRGRLGGSLVVTELALAVTLLVGAALLTRTFAAYARWRPGFETSHLLAFQLFASTGTYKEASDVGALWPRVADAIRTVPGVAAVGAASAGPVFGGVETYEVIVEHTNVPPRSSVRWYDVSPGYFAALGVPVVQGRDLEERDGFGSAPVALVNEALARKYWPGASALGQRIQVPNEKTTFEVVGVVRDVPPLAPGTPTEPEMYWSDRQVPRWATFFVVRTTTPPASVAAVIRSRIERIDPALPPKTMRTLDERLSRELVRPRFNMWLLATFGLAALAIAAIGTYGLMAYVVGQRTREIGIRLALGARPAQVRRDVLARGLALALLGVAIGILGAFALQPVIGHFVSGVSPHDPLAYAAAIVTLLGAAMLACLIPACRASRVDPVEALRTE